MSVGQLMVQLLPLLKQHLVREGPSLQSSVLNNDAAKVVEHWIKIGINSALKLFMTAVVVGVEKMLRGFTSNRRRCLESPYL